MIEVHRIGERLEVGFWDAEWHGWTSGPMNRVGITLSEREAWLLLEALRLVLAGERRVVRRLDKRNSTAYTEEVVGAAE